MADPYEAILGKGMYKWMKTNKNYIERIDLKEF